MDRDEGRRGEGESFKSEEAGTTEQAVEGRQSPVQTAGRSPEAFLWKMLSC